jgi:prepilin-type N-terminal cleavage/methylation domain-containing protein
MNRTTIQKNGFTLIELAVVVFIIGVVMAVATPRLLPTLIFSEHRAAAHQLGDYGRAVMAKAALAGDRFTVYFNLDDQEIWTVQWVVPDPEALEGEVDPDYLNELSGMRNNGLSSEDMASLMAQKRYGEDADLSNIDPDKLAQFSEIDLEKAEEQFNDKFFKFAMRRTLARAENVKHDELLEDVNLFADEFSLEPEDEPIPQELTDPILQRMSMPEGIYIAGAVIEGQYYERGEIELEISPLGLDDKVWFHVVNQDGDYFTVFWNPINNSSLVFEGRRDFY